MRGLATKAVVGRILFQRRPQAKRLSGSELSVALGVGIFVFGAFAAEIVHEFSPQKLSVVFMAMAWAPLLALHELGHALVAALLGWRVCRVAIGIGPTILRFAVNGVPVDVRLFPVSGFVIPAPRSLQAARIKSALVYFAGPGIELCVVGLLVAFVGYDRMRQHDPAIGLILAQSVAAAALLGAGFNLLPLRTKDGTATDGLGILLSFVWPRHHFERMIATPYRILSERRLERGDVAGALRVFENADREHPDDVAVQVARAEVLVEAGRALEARAALLPLLERSPEGDPWRLWLLSNLAEAEREAGDRDDELLGAADEHSEQALALAPAAAWPLLIRGSVLLARGRFHPALKLLAQAKTAAHERLLVDECECWLALADHRRGNRSEARERVEQLRKRGVAGRLVAAVEAEVLGGQPAPQASPAAPG